MKSLSSKDAASKGSGPPNNQDLSHVAMFYQNQPLDRASVGTATPDLAAETHAPLIPHVTGSRIMTS